MRALVVDILLGAAVLSAWLGAFGFLRLKSALDRLHCAAFAYIGGGAFITVAVIVQDGLTDRSVKMIMLLAILLLGGAATSHAIGRALVLRGAAQ